MVSLINIWSSTLYQALTETLLPRRHDWWMQWEVYQIPMNTHVTNQWCYVLLSGFGMDRVCYCQNQTCSRRGDCPYYEGSAAIVSVQILLLPSATGALETRGWRLIHQNLRRGGLCPAVRGLDIPTTCLINATLRRSDNAPPRFPYESLRFQPV